MENANKVINKYLPYVLEACNYKLGRYEVPSCYREVYNDDTNETMVIDYQGHSLVRQFLTDNRDYDFGYLCEMLRLAFDEILNLKIGEKVVITNKGNSFDIVGALYLSEKEDTYVFAIITVIRKSGYQTNCGNKNVIQVDLADELY